VFRVAARVLSEAADAEDVTQETFVRLWRDPGAIDNPAALKGWLARVARNLAIDRIRRAKPSTADGLDELPTAPPRPMARCVMPRLPVWWQRRWPSCQSASERRCN
jgi:RNA polymerase sigma factor (sigma-70 family)